MPYHTTTKTYVNNTIINKGCWLCNANPCLRSELGTLRLAAQHSDHKATATGGCDVKAHWLPTSQICDLVSFRDI